VNEEPATGWDDAVSYERAVTRFADVIDVRIRDA
jgi:hypothetical protein